MSFVSWLARLFPGERPRTNARGRQECLPHARRTRLQVERLEERDMSSTVGLAGGVLTVFGTPQPDRILVSLDPSQTQIVVQDDGRVIGRFATAAVNSINVFAGDGNDRVQIAPKCCKPR